MVLAEARGWSDGADASHEREWVADWVPRSTACGTWGGGVSPTGDAQCLGGAATTGDARPTPMLTDVITFEPFPVASGGGSGRVTELTARFNAAIETAIRRSPPEWVWWHERWRRQPE